jgi:hypothetical protein
MSEQLFIIAYLVIILAYLGGSIVMIYHIFTFGLNTRTAIITTIAYSIGSIILLGLLYGNIQAIININ